jgi:hypothetical protein
MAAMTPSTDPAHELRTGSELPARGALLTLTEAASACGVSRSTMKRRLPDFKNAEQDQTGSWRVPVSDLLGAGLKLRPRPETRTNGQVSQGHDPDQNGAGSARIELLRGKDLQRIEELTADLVAERTARQLAEVRAAAYQANLEDMRLALRAISGPPEPLHVERLPGPRRAAPEPVQPAPAPARRSFRRWFRGS